MKTWEIRHAVASDADALTICMEAAYAEQIARIPNLPVLSADYADEIQRYQVWVADAGTTVAGGLILVPGEKFMMLANIAVHPEYRGTGLGRALLSLADDQARNQGFRQMRLKTHVDMSDNIELYRRLGWRETGRSGDAISMEKPV